MAAEQEAAERALLEAYGGLLFAGECPDGTAQCCAPAQCAAHCPELDAVPARAHAVQTGADTWLHTVTADALGLEDMCPPSLCANGASSVHGADASGEPCDEKTHVVLLHGYGAGLGYYYRNIAPLARALRGVARVHAVDWMGMGRSARPSFPRYSRRAGLWPFASAGSSQSGNGTTVNSKMGNDTSVSSDLGTDTTVNSESGNAEDAQRGEDDCIAADDRIAADVDAAIAFFIGPLEAWRESMGIERMVLVGHSLGGYLAATYALRHASRVTRLVLASPVGLPRQTDHAPGTAVTGRPLPRWVAALWDANLTPAAVVRGLGRALGSRFARGYVDARFAKVLPDAAERAALAHYTHVVASAGPASGEYALAALLAPGAWAREPLHGRLSALRCDVLFMYGESDWMDRRHAEAVAAELAVAHAVVSVAGAGHQLHVDNAAVFNTLVASFILRGLCDLSA